MNYVSIFINAKIEKNQISVSFCKKSKKSPIKKSDLDFWCVGFCFFSP